MIIIGLVVILYTISNIHYCLPPQHLLKIGEEDFLYILCHKNGDPDESFIYSIFTSHFVYTKLFSFEIFSHLIQLCNLRTRKAFQWRFHLFGLESPP